MSKDDAPRDAEIEKVNDQLNDGLRTCRSVLNDYRAILSSPQESISAEESLIDSFRTQDGSNL